MPTFDMMKIGSNIMRARKAKGMTQMQLANALGISFQAVSNWERGQSCPDISKLGELSELLGVSIDEILGNRRAAELVAQDEALEKQSAADKPSGDPRVAVFTVNTPDDKADADAEPDVTLKLAGKFPLSSVAEVAPFLSEKFVDMLVEKTIDSGEAASADDIAALAPFMSAEALKKAAEKLSGGLTDLGPVTALAPFLETETLDHIALEAAEAGGQGRAVTARGACSVPLGRSDSGAPRALVKGRRSGPRGSRRPRALRSRKSAGRACKKAVRRRRRPLGASWHSPVPLGGDGNGARGKVHKEARSQGRGSAHAVYRQRSP